MSRNAMPPIRVSEPKPLRGDVNAQELKHFLKGFDYIEPVDMPSEDAVLYLKQSSGLSFPWYNDSRPAWDSPETADFITGVIVMLFERGVITVERGGTLRTTLGDTEFVDQSRRGMTICLT